MKGWPHREHVSADKKLTLRHISTTGLIGASASVQGVKVAAAQIAPVFLDRARTLEKVVAAVEEAATRGCALVGFGEVMVPGYPIWLDRTGGAEFDNAAQKDLYALYVDQSVDIEGGDLGPVCEVAAQTSTAVILGVAERAGDRGGHSVYCSRVFIDECGEIVSVHRKLMPTYEERLVWASGDGAGLVVHKVAEFTVGALNCWENWLPLARAALHGQGENFHVALWPGSPGNTENSTPFMAFEGRSYVMSVSALLRAEDIPADFPMRDRLVNSEDEVLHSGGSCVARPDGSWLLEPVGPVEGVFDVEIDLTEVRRSRQNLDISGHYSRPDVLQLHVDRRRQSVVTFDD